MKDVSIPCHCSPKVVEIYHIGNGSVVCGTALEVIGEQGSRPGPTEYSLRPQDYERLEQDGVSERLMECIADGDSGMFHPAGCKLLVSNCEDKEKGTF